MLIYYINYPSIAMSKTKENPCVKQFGVCLKIYFDLWVYVVELICCCFISHNQVHVHASLHFFVFFLDYVNDNLLLCIS